MADRKLFQDLILTSTPLTTDRFALGKSGSPYKNITAADLRTWIISAVPPIPPTPTILQKSVNIGAWNMLGTPGKSVSLGVARSKIRGIQVTIISDSGSLQDIGHPHSNEEISAWWKINYTTSASNAQIDLSRKWDFYFSNGNFDNGSINRGYILVSYVE